MGADRPVLIAGGGIGGLALALALSQAGRRAIVRTPSSKHCDIQAPSPSVRQRTRARDTVSATGG